MAREQQPPEADAGGEPPLVGRLDRVLHWYVRASLGVFGVLLLVVGGRWAPPIAPFVALALYVTAGKSGRAYRRFAGVLGALLVLEASWRPAAALLGDDLIGILIAVPVALGLGVVIARRAPAAAAPE